MRPERGGFDGLVGPTFQGGGTNKCELQAQERDRRESRHAAPESGGFGAQGEPGPSLPGVRRSSRGRSLASSLSPGNDLGVRSAEKSGPERVGGCSLYPGGSGRRAGRSSLLPGGRGPGIGRVGGTCSHRRSAQLVGSPLTPGSEVWAWDTAPTGPGQGVRRGRRVPRPRREGARLVPPVPVPVRPAPLPDTH